MARIALLISLCLLTCIPAQAQDALSSAEMREALLRLNQLTLAWEEIRLLKASMEREAALTEKERALATRELETEKAKTALAEKETALQKERADFFEMAFKEATKGRSLGCHLLKAVTLTLARCR